MLKMGFPRRWVHRIIECVTKVSYSFLVNGQLSVSMIPHRGLRQGDSLSPYLFLLCAENLGALIKKAYASKMLRGVAIARGAPDITHLFFADDSIIFTRATVQEAKTIRNILSHYEFLFGQKINVEKSEISFSSKLESRTCHLIKVSLGFVGVAMHGKYLGLPMIFDKSKKIFFATLRNWVWKKLQGWKEKLLSRARKEVLIKTVVQTIPSFAMSCFQLPFGLCKD